MKKEDFPLVLKVAHVAKVLGVSKHTAYKIIDSNGFPVLFVGNRKLVSRDVFFDWLENRLEFKK